jgi:hypothetical protein
LRLYNGKTPDAIKLLARANGHYTYDKLLEDAVMSYQSLVEQQLWGPAVANMDCGRAPEGNNAESNALVQKKRTDSTLLKSSASNVVKKGFADQIAQRKIQDQIMVAEVATTPNTNRNKKASWKTKPPASGTPETKTVDSKEWHWCQVSKAFPLS